MLSLTFIPFVRLRLLASYPILTILGILARSYGVIIRIIRGKRSPIGIWFAGGFPALASIEGAIGLRLLSQGEDVTAIVCDGVNPACMQRDSKTSPLKSLGLNDSFKSNCGNCFSNCSRELIKFGIKVQPFSEYITQGTVSSVEGQARNLISSVNGLAPTYSHRGIDFESILKSSLTRYYKSPNQSYWEDSAKVQFTAAIILNIEIAIEWLKRNHFSNVLMSHGVYSDFSPALRVATTRGIPVTYYSGGHVPFAYFFRRLHEGADLSTRRISDKSWHSQLEYLGVKEIAILDSYVQDRYTSAHSSDLYGMPLSQPTERALEESYWLVLAHLNWDATADLTPMLYRNFDVWIVETIKLAIKTPGINWKIKLHPAEIASGGRHGVGELISTNFSKLPKNIEIITHNDSNTLDLLKQSSGVITCYGTSGLEAATFGIPTILAGEAYYGRKGFTLDPQTIEEYESLLLNIGQISKLDDAQKELAKKFAYLVWIEHQYILDWLDDSNVTNKQKKKSLMLHDKNAIRIFKKESVMSKITTQHFSQY